MIITYHFEMLQAQYCILHRSLFDIEGKVQINAFSQLSFTALKAMWGKCTTYCLKQKHDALVNLTKGITNLTTYDDLFGTNVNLYSDSLVLLLSSNIP